MDDIKDFEYDCIVIGHNELEFNKSYAASMNQRNTSGAWHELASNSVEYQGRRLSYTELLNIALRLNAGCDLIGVPEYINAFDAPHLGALTIASRLEREGLKTKVINFFNTEKGSLKSALNSGTRAVAVTTTYYVSDDPIIEIVKFIRRTSAETKIIVGGPRIYSIQSSIRDDRHLTLYLRMIGADFYIVDSQGELTLSRLVKMLSQPIWDLSTIPNLIYWEGGGSPRLRFSERCAENTNLEQSKVDWRRFPQLSVKGCASMRTALSCPFSCAFCNYPGFAGRHRYADVDDVIADLRELADIGVNRVNFIDDTFNVPLPRFKLLLKQMIKADLGLKWTSFFRCSNADDEAFDLMAESGCESVFLGIESGDQSVLENMRKFAKVERYLNAVQRITSLGIETLASIIIGFPGESERTVDNTIRFLVESETSYFTVQLYYHDVLAPIENDREVYSIEGSGFSWAHASMDWEEACHHKERVLREVRTSTILPLYGLGIWSLPYLRERGITSAQIHNFLEISNSRMLETFEFESGWTDEKLDSELAQVFSRHAFGGNVDQLFRPKVSL